jgi:hypothetical protein
LLPPGPKLAASDIRQYVKDVQPSPPKLLNGQLWAQADAVVWEGEPKPKVAGADIGNRLYAGKKRMFKGHKRERTKAKRDIRRSILLSNMQKRIIRYKSVSLFCCFGLLASTDEPLASTIAEDGRTRSNLQKFPSQRNYPSNYNGIQPGDWTIAYYICNHCVYTQQSHFPLLCPFEIPMRRLRPTSDPLYVRSDHASSR